MTAPDTTLTRTTSPRLRRARRRLSPGPVTALLVLVCLSLMLVDLRGGPTDALRVIGGWVGGPLQSAADAVFGPVRSAEFRRGDIEQLRADVADLTERNQRLQTENDLLSQELHDAPADRAAAAEAQRRVESALVARTVAADPALGSGAVTIDAGAEDGVVLDSPVLVAGGLVGRVVRTAPSTSEVLLVTDPASSVAVRMGDQGALVRGTGDRHAARLDFVDPLAPVEVGRRVVTMGSDDGWPYPAGLPVGTVSSVTGELGELDRTVVIEPAVTLSALDRVLVLTRPTDSARVTEGDS